MGQKPKIAGPAERRGGQLGQRVGIDQAARAGQLNVLLAGDLLDQAAHLLVLAFDRAEQLVEAGAVRRGHGGDRVQ